MSWIQSAIGSVADTISARQRYQGIDIAGAESGAGYSRAVSQQQQGQDQLRQTYQPWMQAGTRSLANAQKIAGNAENINPASDAGYRQKNSLTDPGQFSFSTTGPNADPSYKWRFDEGMRGVNASAAARGGFFSGNTGVALNNYGQGMASTEFSNQFGRYQTTLADYMNQENFNAEQYNQAYDRQMGIEQNAYNQEMGIANMGMGATNQFASGNMSFDNNLANLWIAQGQNSADTTMAKYENIAGANDKIASRWSGNNMFSGMSSGGGYGGTGTTWKTGNVNQFQLGGQAQGPTQYAQY